ncbi:MULTISPECIES: class III lanthipeptide [Streptomycetaceae]|nr:class III lanthipeptide [Streptomyces sp. CB02056]
MMADILALQELDEEIVVDAPFSSLSYWSC